MTVTTYRVRGMTCGHCVSTVTTAVGAVPGVTGVEVDLPAATVTTTGNPAERAVARALTDAGYDVVSTERAVGRPLPMAGGSGGCCCG